MQIKMKLKSILYLIAICAVVFCVVFRFDRMTVGWIAWGIFGYMTPSGLFIFCLFRVTRGGSLTPSLITCILLSVSLFGWPTVFIGAFQTEPLRRALLLATVGIGVCVGLHWNQEIKKARATGPGHPVNNAARLNACLFASVVAFLGAWQGITWLVWNVGQSVGIAVQNDDAGWLSFEFYGNSVNHKTVGIALGPRVAPGCVEGFKLFGLRFSRGFLPYDKDTSNGVHLVRHIAFHRTQVGDWIIPVLTQFSELTSLDLRGTRITCAGVREIQMALPSCEIVR
jgi:hypothetical protein